MYEGLGAPGSVGGFLSSKSRVTPEQVYGERALAEIAPEPGALPALAGAEEMVAGRRAVGAIGEVGLPTDSPLDGIGQVITDAAPDMPARYRLGVTELPTGPETAVGRDIGRTVRWDQPRPPEERVTARAPAPITGVVVPTELQGRVTPGQVYGERALADIDPRRIEGVVVPPRLQSFRDRVTPGQVYGERALADIDPRRIEGVDIPPRLQSFRGRATPGRVYGERTFSEIEDDAILRPAITLGKK